MLSGMVATRTQPTTPAVDPGEQRMLVHVTWKEYVVLREVIDSPGLRMTYCEGALELVTVSRLHELRKTTIARLIELYAFLRGWPLIGYGSTTFKNEVTQRGAEPDECWCVGKQMRDGEFPHIVLEVTHTNPLLDKLRVYDGFAVPEVWLWQDGLFELHGRLPEGGYRRIERSALLPELDFAVVAQFAVREDQDVALRELADAIRRV